MTAERYRVGSVTGYGIEGSEGLGNAGPLCTIWYIHDTCNCYQIVKSFKGEQNQEQKARALAARLNAHDENPEPPMPGKTHCKHGHRFDILNTYMDKKGAKVCRICRLASMHRSRARELAARIARARQSL